MIALPPLAYGYIRVDLVDGDRLAECEYRLVSAASALGCQLGSIFRESSPQTATVPPAYLDLVQECCRTEAHTVITGCDHLSGMAVPRMCLLEMLAERAHAQVYEVAL